MTKLRVSSHRLEIEVGRWARPNRTPINERKCRYCDKLEDEFHFLLECTQYVELMKQYIQKYFWNRPNMLKLKELMSTKNRNIIKKKTQRYILKRLLILDMAKRMYRHNDMMEVVFSTFWYTSLVFLLFVIILKWYCQFIKMSPVLWNDICQFERIMTLPFEPTLYFYNHMYFICMYINTVDPRYLDLAYLE